MAVVKNMMVRVGADFSGLISGSQKALGQTQTWASGTKSALSSVASAGAGLNQMLRVLGISLSIAGLSAYINQITTLGDEIDKSSQKVGMSAEAYQEWDYVLERCGTSMDAMQSASQKLATAAQTGSAALERLGLSRERVAGMSREELWDETIRRLQNVSDETERAYLAQQLLGRGASELGAVLNMTSQETDALRRRVGTLGGVFSSKATHNAAAFKDALTDTKAALKGVGNTVLETFVPSLTLLINRGLIPVINALSSFIAGTAKAANTFHGFLSALFGVAADDIATGTSAIAGYTAAAEDAADAGYNIGSATADGADKAARAAGSAAAALRQLYGFDKINKIQSQSSGGGGGGSGGSSGGGSGGGGGGDMASALGNTAMQIAQDGGPLDTISQKLRGMTGLLDAARTAFANLKGAAEAVKTSLVNVWNDGTGQQYVQSLQTKWTAFCNVISALSGTFTDAWTEAGRGDGVIRSILQVATSVNNMIGSIAQSFANAWNNGTGKKIWADILDTVTSVNNTVKNLANNFTTAWNKAKTGDGIMSSILGIVQSVTDGVKSIAKATEDWAANLNFKPLLTSIKGLMESIKPIVDDVKTALVWVWDKFILPLSAWILETGLPKFLDGVAAACQIIHDALQPVGSEIDKFYKLFHGDSDEIGISQADVDIVKKCGIELDVSYSAGSKEKVDSVNATAGEKKSNLSASWKSTADGTRATMYSGIGNKTVNATQGATWSGTSGKFAGDFLGLANKTVNATQGATWSGTSGEIAGEYSGLANKTVNATQGATWSGTSGKFAGDFLGLANKTVNATQGATWSTGSESRANVYRGNLVTKAITGTMNAAWGSNAWGRFSYYVDSVRTKTTEGTMKAAWGSNAWSRFSYYVDKIKTKTVTGTVNAKAGSKIKVADIIKPGQIKITDSSGNSKTTWNLVPKARGGIINAATILGPYLVGEAGREAIVPLENNTEWTGQVARLMMQAMSRERGGGAENISLTVNLDGETVYRSVIRHGEQDAARGNHPLAGLV